MQGQGTDSGAYPHKSSSGASNEGGPRRAASHCQLKVEDGAAQSRPPANLPSMKAHAQVKPGKQSVES